MGVPNSTDPSGLLEKHLSGNRFSPTALYQSTMNTFCKTPAAGPAILSWVSRHESKPAHYPGALPPDVHSTDSADPTIHDAYLSMIAVADGVQPPKGEVGATRTPSSCSAAK